MVIYHLVNNCEKVIQCFHTKPLGRFGPCQSPVAGGYQQLPVTAQFTWTLEQFSCSVNAGFNTSSLQK
ncbi:hypothetical protein ATANTOWER_016785 [Ataeniobius toweri]|uniref:Uncharacterized protein n=1 Tax=Ataeniobius toweri TaxID=208326 RepID=A0ABU7BIN4_9TELE|nr:hypothetical protein [Ataeniobius toweri]